MGTPKIVAQNGPLRYLVDAGTGSAVGADDVPLLRIYDRATGSLGDPLPAASVGSHSPGWTDPTDPSLRHGFASLLIANGLNVVFASRQLGHANPSITLDVYAHLFQRADHEQAARAALEASYTATVATNG